MKWLVEKLLPLNNRAEDVAPEGSFKTTFGCWLSVCIASGRPVFGHDVKAGPVLIADKETPMESLEDHLDRFSWGLGYPDYRHLPNEILIYRDNDLYFDRTTAMRNLKDKVKELKPVFIRIDSLLAMLPLGRQGINENTSQLGGLIGRELNEILALTEGSTMLAVHAKKYVAEMSLEQVEQSEMQTLARGHSSIVGEGSDTGYLLVKVSQYPAPTRFAIVPRVRRSAIDQKTILVEMKEEAYGSGKAWLEQIPLSALPPSEAAKAVYQYINSVNDEVSASKIKSDLAFHTKNELKDGVKELLFRKVLVNQNKPHVYEINPRMYQECEADYLKQL